MQLISQHTKRIMEHCKERAISAGLRFESDTLEYIVSNRDLLELTPKVMIPTLYDYWVNDVEVLKEMGKYKIYPANPYETVINSRPAISYYNDNNPDWLNIMIFYHVLGHIDFFQNNKMFAHTWSDDFVGKALADKRLLADLRSKKGRWVDYAIEFSRNINNLNAYFRELNFLQHQDKEPPSALDYYFGDFLQEEVKISENEVFNEISRYNQLLQTHAQLAEPLFFHEIREKYPEFASKYDNFLQHWEQKSSVDLIEFIRDNSPFLRKSENQWIKSVMTVVRDTAVYFEPQIRTKIINEGWASYWHDELFRQDDRIKGHEIGYAKINAMVTSVQKVGLNPYALGLRLVQYVEELANKGKLTKHFQRMENAENRENYNQNTNRGKEAIFKLRDNFSDFTLLKTFIDQDFVDAHELYVIGQRYNEENESIQYYIKSRKAEDYQQMAINTLYHPPHVTVDTQKTDDSVLCLAHHFEGKPLLEDFVQDTLMGIAYLWGGEVQLLSHDITPKDIDDNPNTPDEIKRVVYAYKNGRVEKHRE